jgi:nucleoside-diphosphate-sugar epimerase
MEDVAEGILQLLDTSRAHGEVINLASGQGISIRDVIEKIQHRVQSGSPDFGRESKGKKGRNPEHEKQPHALRINRPIRRPGHPRRLVVKI